MGPALLQTPQPHHIPGYGGHVPQYIFRTGDTYGSLTHKLLLDPSVNHGERLILSDRTITDYQLLRPYKTDIDLVKSRFKTRDALFKHPIIPGYKGTLPKMQEQLGQRFAVEAIEGVATFEKEQIKNQQTLEQLEREVAVLNDKIDPTIDDLQMIKTEFKLPLLEVRPEACGIIRSLIVEEPQPMPEPDPTSPYFMDVTDPNKKFIPGYGGHIPFGQSKYGEGYTPFTNSALTEFTTNYRQKKSTEWAPVNVARPEPPLMISPSEIYPKQLGMVPNYTGHIPGQIFRQGKTYGNDTRDAKRWLRGDFST